MIKTTNKGIDYVSYHPEKEVNAENAGIMNPIHRPSVTNEDAYLRNKYTDAVLIAMRMMYDDWTIHDYEKYLKRQANENTISEQAPNEDYYERPDILAKKSKGIERDEAVRQLRNTSKYTTVIDWSHTRPNYLHLTGKQLNEYKFKDEDYEFYLVERIPDYKRISSLMYDKLVVQVYMKPKNSTEYNHVAVVHLYYYSGSRYVRRYTNLFTEDDRELVDPTHYNEWLYDTYKRQVDISEDDLTSALELEQLKKIGHVQLYYANNNDSDGTLIKTY